MALAVNDILQILTFFDAGGVDALMVSFWKVNAMATPNTYACLAEAFGFVMMNEAAVANLMISDSTLNRTVINSITNPLEYGEFANNINGIISGDAAPSFVAISVKQNVEDRSTRAGYKRIPFVGEDTSSWNNPAISGGTSAAIQGFFGDVAVIIYTSTEFGDIDIELKPVVMGRVEDPPGSGNYVLDPTRVNPVTSAVIQGPTSQNSRKS